MVTATGATHAFSIEDANIEFTDTETEIGSDYKANNNNGTFWPY